MSFALLLVAACSDVNLNYKDAPLPMVQPGVIRGRVCDPSGRTWLPDALAYVNISEDGKVVDTRKAYTDVDGRFTLDTLPGENDYTIFVQYGPDLLSEESLYLESGQEIDMEEPDCFDPLSINVAVITGDYDDFNVVLNQMGFANYTLIDGLDEVVLNDFLGSGEEMAKYDFIFFNGGFVETDIIYGEGDAATNMENVRAYVEAGGVIYASDWAYDVVEIGWPEAVDFVGADEVPDDAQKGDYASVNAAVSDASLSEFLGTTYVEVLYDLPVWPPVENVSPSVSIHLTGSVPYSDGLSEYQLAQVPLLFSFNAGEGKVVFSTFRVARNSSEDMLETLTYMMYSL